MCAHYLTHAAHYLTYARSPIPKPAKIYCNFNVRRFFVRSQYTKNVYKKVPYKKKSIMKKFLIKNHYGKKSIMKKIPYKKSLWQKIHYKKSLRQKCYTKIVIKNYWSGYECELIFNWTKRPKTKHSLLFLHILSVIPCIFLNKKLFYEFIFE